MGILRKRLASFPKRKLLEIATVCFCAWGWFLYLRAPHLRKYQYALYNIGTFSGQSVRIALFESNDPDAARLNCSWDIDDIVAAHGADLRERYYCEKLKSSE